MNYKILVGKITEYLHLCTVELSKWLENRLPTVLGKDWWNNGVVDKLSHNQQEMIDAKSIRSLSGLDLSALLRIIDKNWYYIQGRYFLNQSERMTIRKMLGVRNNWAHAAAIPPDIELITSDLKTLNELLRFLDADKDSLIEFEHIQNSLHSLGITDVNLPISKKELMVPVSPISQVSEIVMNSIVHLVSDSKSVGMVVGIDKIGNISRYKVFIDGRTRDFFEGQIELKKEPETTEFTGISEIQRILTAYQIKRPSSDSLYSLNAARIDFVPYQFRPALKLIKSDTPRLLVADSVGVGKTIEAGLLLKEMQARAALDTVIIICPKPLVAERKWEIEMKRFDEDFTSVDGNLLRHIIEEAYRDGEWPDKYKRLIIPYSLLTEDLLSGKKNRKGRSQRGLYDLDPTPFFDMVIVDEAHHIRNSSTQAYRAAKFFCDNANAAVFLTATPIQLGNEDLFTLLNLLRPDIVIDRPTFNAMAEPNVYINTALRNLRVANHEKEALNAIRSASKTDWGENVLAPSPLFQQAVYTLSEGQINREQRVKLINDIESLHSFSSMINRTRRQDIEDFCIRRAYTLQSEFTSGQRELHDELLNFVSSVLGKLHPSISLKFLMCTIRRQAASCIFGLAPFIRDIVKRGLGSLSDDYDMQEFVGDLDKDIPDIEMLAKNVIELAERLPTEEKDSKLSGLVEIIIERQGRENNKIIIFSTFRHTLKYLNKKISAIENIRVAYIDGNTKDDERYKLRERFALEKKEFQALDILLFTEVGSEGLDYQFCDTIVNYDLPWNPMRIEQRIGRIDRRGQKSDVAHIYNCVTHGTIDEEIFDRCLSRIGVFEHSIGDCPEILGDLAKSIQDIILDINLTEEERSLKLEQMADNEVRQVQEMRRLEDDEKQMFGLDISSYTDELERADNPWLSPEALKQLVLGYLEERLGPDRARFSNNKLRLTLAEKNKLKDDYKSLGYAGSDHMWAKFLRSSTRVCNIAFDQDTAKDPKVLLFSPMHPLVRQAAKLIHYSERPFTTSIEISSSDIAPGKYMFQFYIWDFTGGRPRMELLPICANEDVQYELPTIMQSAISYETKVDKDEKMWSKLAETHLLLWQREREKYKNEIGALNRFKIESLIKSFNARKNSATKQMNETSNEQIIQMRKSEIERLDNEFNIKKSKLENDTCLADIHTTLLVNGLLVVRGE